MDRITRLLLSATLALSALPSFASAGLLEGNPLGTAPPTGKASVSAPAPVKIGYIDLRKLAAESDAGKAATKELQEKTEKLQARIKEKEKQLEKLKASLEAKAATMSLEKRGAKAKEFQKKVEEYRDFARKSEKEMRARDDELSLKIIEKIEKVVRDYGKANGFSVIAANRELLYVEEGITPKDLTEEVLPLLNAK